MQNYEELSIIGPAFEEVASNFDTMLQRLMKKMQDSNSDEGKITLEVSIYNESVWIDTDAELGDKSNFGKKPILKHKVSTQIPIKDSTDNKTTETGMLLVWNKDLCRYVLVYAPTQQTTMYDQPQYTAAVVTDPPLLAQGNVIDLTALPPASGDDN